VARGWGIPAVVGATGIDVRDGTVVVGDRVLRAGDVITIDGSTGEVFEGAIPGASEVVPEARTLLAWARELGIDVDDEASSPAQAASVGRAVSRKVTPGECLRAIGIKGFAIIEGVADAVLSTPDDVRPALDQLTVDGYLTASAGAYRLTDTGKQEVARMLSAEQAAWGFDQATAALDAFLALDHRVKEVVTAWQLRDEGPRGPVMNDHADAEYDHAILGRLAGLHDETIAWLTPLEAGCPRLAAYGVRLGRAIEQAVVGEPRYVASPRVDSYHGIWFELHEDLIQLAGRSREDEVAAGRA
jgi:pyruvate,orthophosphate dikinase